MNIQLSQAFWYGPIPFLFLGQLPTGQISPPEKDKTQLLPTRTTIPRTVGQLSTRATPHQDYYQQVKPLIKTNIYKVESCPDTPVFAGRILREGASAAWDVITHPNSYLFL